MKTDSQLINEFIKDNKSKAFEEIVLRHQKTIYNVCLRILRSPTDAEDATQATFLTLIKKAKASTETVEIQADSDEGTLPGNGSAETK